MGELSDLIAQKRVILQTPSTPDTSVSDQSQSQEPKLSDQISQRRKELNPDSVPIQQPDINAPQKPPMGMLDLSKPMQTGSDQRAQAAQQRTDYFNTLIKNKDLGGSYDETPGNMGFGTQFNIARSDNEKDVRQKFLEAHPEGDITFEKDKNGAPVTLYRTDKQDNWHPARQGMADLAALGTNPSVLAGVGAGVLTGGASIPIQAAGQAVAGGVGSLINTGIEKVQGYDQDKGLGRVAGETTLNAVIGSGGALLGHIGTAASALKSGVSGAMDTYYNMLASAARQGGVGFGKFFQESADRLGLPGPTIGQAGSEIERERFKLALNTDSARQAVEGQNLAVKNKLEELANSGITLTKDQLEALQNGQLQDATDKLQQLKALPQGATSTDAGRATALAVQKYDQASGNALDAKIADLENNAKINDVKFNIGRAKSTWQDIKTGISGVGNQADDNGVAGAVPIRQPSPSMISLGQKFEDLAKTMENADLTREMPSGTDRRIAPTIKTDSALKQLTSLRDQLSVLANGGDPDAARMLVEVKKSLDNPIGASKEVLDGIQDVNTAQSAREGNLALLRGQLNTSNADKLGTGLIAPGNGRQLAIIQKTDPESFSTIQDAFRGDLMNDLSQVPRKFAKFANDQPTLDSVIPREEQLAWRDLARQKGLIDKSVASKRVNNAIGDNVSLLMGDGKMSASELTNLVTESARQSGVSDIYKSPAAMQAKSELYGNVVKNATETSGAAGGIDTLNVTKAKSAISSIEKDPRFSSILGPEDHQSMKDLQTYLSMIETSRFSAGGGIGQAGVVKHIFSPVKAVSNPKGWTMSLLTNFNNETAGAVLSKPAAVKLLLKAEDEGPTNRGLLMLTGALAMGAKQSYDRSSAQSGDVENQ